MSTSTITRKDTSDLALSNVPSTHGEVQSFSVARMNPLALESSACLASIDYMNQLLADTLTLRDLYKKHHWQAAGPSFQQMHMLFDRLCDEQTTLVDIIAERVQTLGGVTIAMAPDVAEATIIPRAPIGREDTSSQIGRLLHAHEIILLEARAMARDTAESGDVGTNDIIVSDVIRTNELQSWCLSQHLR